MVEPFVMEGPFVGHAKPRLSCQVTYYATPKNLSCLFAQLLINLDPQVGDVASSEQGRCAAASRGSYRFEMNHKETRIVDVVELPLQNEQGGSFIARVREVIKVIRAGHSPKRDHAMRDPSELPSKSQKQDGK
jgi:hypothetical protein